MSHTILIIEDEKELASIVAAYLKIEGFQVEIANDGKSGLEAFHRFNPSVVLLDIMLPLLDGIEVCKEIRAVSDASIIIISAKNGEMDKVIALGIGADDYVTKPFSPIEVVARVKAQIRRYEKMLHQEKEENPSTLVSGELMLTKSSYTATAKGETLNLTTKEFDMLYYLASSPNQVFSKEQIYEAVWGYNECGDDNSVTVYVNRIREKLDHYGLNYIKTVWGAGYKFFPQ
ncbi:response regulator transcription factor [Anaerosporobacter faecicola]|uniref:response regulator transcription factor n=1 Tax=Anaerosporobacter faecicola TaxID=2718714 RepID=UPI00143AD20F|nr:response regulator transcription factor [Anaerosporobacter faecicola]